MNKEKKKFYNKSRKVRLALPSKGRMEEETQVFLNECGFNIKRNNRQYIGSISEPMELQLVYQRQVDIVRGVLNSSLELGIVGYDLVLEHLPDQSKELVVIHDALNFGKCSLEIAVPEDWLESSIEEIKLKGEITKIRVATKFPKLTQQFLTSHEICFEIVKGNGSLEVYPELGYSDIIVDLVSTGKTLKDNRLKRINGGKLMASEAVLIGNRTALEDKAVLKVTREMVEYFEATLRARNYVSVFINMRGEDPKSIAERMFDKEGLEGLQGPTISPIISSESGSWFAVHIIVDKRKLTKTIRALREIGGSGVVVSPTLFIFEEEPKRYKQLLKNLEEN